MKYDFFACMGHFWKMNHPGKIFLSHTELAVCMYEGGRESVFFPQASCTMHVFLRRSKKLLGARSDGSWWFFPAMSDWSQTRIGCTTKQNLFLGYRSLIFIKNLSLHRPSASQKLALTTNLTLAKCSFTTHYCSHKVRLIANWTKHIISELFW